MTAYTQTGMEYGAEKYLKDTASIESIEMLTGLSIAISLKRIADKLDFMSYSDMYGSGLRVLTTEVDR